MIRRAAIAVSVVVIACGSASNVASLQRAAAPAIQPVFWCPMHPDVRGREGDKCPLCGMALVRAAAADASAYLLDLETIPRVLRAQQKARARFVVRDPRTNATVRRFDLVHERVFHLFVVSQDLDYFTHVHPTLHEDGSLDVGIELPRPGVYQLIADFCRPVDRRSSCRNRSSPPATPVHSSPCRRCRATPPTRSSATRA